MKTREITIFNGTKFDVPQCVQRIDHRATHGWQVRYGGTQLFSDHTSDGSGAKQSLVLATRELLKRIAAMPAPTKLQRGPSQNKTNDLPVGITGPVVRTRREGRVRDCCLAVLVPRYGSTSLRRTVYIGTENTYSVEKYHAALEKAKAMRQEAEEAYQRAETKAKRADGKAFKASLTA
jgi:hypothetical protein